jgi:molybdopterin converting factor small subunit
MGAATGRDHEGETVTVRYWAGARAAAGTAEDTFEVDAELTLAALVAQVLERHPGDQMARTVAVCSVLLGDQPVRSQDPAAVVVRPGAVVELLPPFAGG